MISFTFLPTTISWLNPVTFKKAELTETKRNCPAWFDRQTEMTSPNSVYIEASRCSLSVAPHPPAFALIQSAPFPQSPVSEKPIPESIPALSWIDHSSGCPGVEIIREIGEVTSDELWRG